MGLLRTLALEPAARSAWDDYWYDKGNWTQSIAQTTAAGVAVTPDAAMRLTAVWACVSLISDSVASLPLILYRRGERDVRERASDDPLYRLLHDAPNPSQTAFDFRQYLTVCALVRGNGYAQIIHSGGRPQSLVPINPDAVTVERVGGEMRYRVRGRSGDETVLLADDVFHLRGLSLDGGYTGVSVIEYSARTVGLSIATEEHGASYFGNGARPGAILAPKERLSQDALDRLKGAWNSEFRGPSRSGSVAALPIDVTYTPLTIPNNDSQFLETREFQVREIARMFRTPLHMIQETTKDTSWGSGLEQQSLGFVIYCLRPWLIRWEQAAGLRFGLDSSRQYFEHIVDALLRGDIKSRFEALQIARQNGIINGEQWARMENWPVPEGRAGTMYWRPANMADAEQEIAPAEPPTPSTPGVGTPPGAVTTTGTSAQFVVVGSTVSVSPLAERLLRAAGARVIRREIGAVSRLFERHADDRAALLRAVDEFYDAHAAYVADAMALPMGEAIDHTIMQRRALEDCGAAVMADWPTAGVEAIVQRAIAAAGGTT